MLGVESAVIKQSLVLVHAHIGRNIVVLAPAAERVEEQDWVLEAELDELLAGVLEEENVAIMERVSHLECVDSIGALLSKSASDLCGVQSEVVDTVVELDLGEEAHGGTGDEEVSLGHDGLSLGVVGREAAEGTSADLLLSVLEEGGLVHNSVDTVVAEGSAPQSNLRLLFEGSLLFASHVLSDGNRKKVAFAKSIGHGLHVH